MTSSTATATSNRKNDAGVAPKWQTDPIAFAKLFFGEDLGAKPKRHGKNVKCSRALRQEITRTVVSWSAVIAEGCFRGPSPTKEVIVPFSKVDIAPPASPIGFILILAEGAVDTEKLTKEQPVGAGFVLKLKPESVSAIFDAAGVPEIFVTGQGLTVTPLPKGHVIPIWHRQNEHGHLSIDNTMH